MKAERAYFGFRPTGYLLNFIPFHCSEQNEPSERLNCLFLCLVLLCLSIKNNNFDIVIYLTV